MFLLIGFLPVFFIGTDSVFRLMTNFLNIIFCFLEEAAVAIFSIALGLSCLAESTEVFAFMAEGIDSLFF